VAVSNPQYWFRAKHYGYGWGLPATWQGWAVFGGYLAVVLLPLAFGNTGAWVSLVAFALATPALVWVSYRKGEPPRWRWGRKA
jgi:hypothetical protein